MLVFILAEDEIAGEILLFPQCMFSLDWKAVLLMVQLLSVHPGEAGWMTSGSFCRDPGPRAP